MHDRNAGSISDGSQQPGLIIPVGDFVAIHGRIRGWTEKPQIVVDRSRIEDGKLAERWDVLQDEVGLSGTRQHIDVQS